MDEDGAPLSKEEAEQLPEHDGTLTNVAIEFEATNMAFANSEEELAQVAESSENAAKHQAEQELQAVELELQEAEANLARIQAEHDSAIVALEDVNVEVQDSEAFTEDMGKRMTAAATEVDRTTKELKKAKDDLSSAQARMETANQKLKEAISRAQRTYDRTVGAAKERYTQIVRAKYTGGDADYEAYLQACGELETAKAQLLKARADDNVDASERGRALLAVDKAINAVEEAKAKLDAKGLEEKQLLTVDNQNELDYTNSNEEANGNVGEGLYREDVRGASGTGGTGEGSRTVVRNSIAGRDSGDLVSTGGYDTRGSGGGHRDNGSVKYESTTGITEVSATPETYVEALAKAKAARPEDGHQVSAHSAEDITEHGLRPYLTGDGLAGFAIEQNGNITGVFKNPESKQRGVLTDMMLTAIANGGDRLDCYAGDLFNASLGDRQRIGSLVNKYAKYGFEPVAVVKYNPEYAESDKIQDIVFFAHNGKNVEEIQADLEQRTYADQMDDVVTYMVDRYALERRDAGKDLLNENEFPTDQLIDYWAKMNQNHPEVARAADAITGFWNEMLDAWGVDTGLISWTDVQRMREAYKYYVPTRRVMNRGDYAQYGSGSKFRIRGAVKGGSSLEIINPIASFFVFICFVWFI